MSDWFYKTVVLLGRPAFTVSSRATVLHRERADRAGAFILAASHLSPYDVPLLMGSTPRVLDFVSIVEVFKKPLVGWLFRNMGAFPLNRHQSDPKTVKIILDRLARGRVVAMFPEGRIKDESDSVIHGARFRPGVARLARMAKAPIIPAVILNSAVFSNFTSWLPLRRTRYGIIYGEPIEVTEEEEGEQSLGFAYRELFEELNAKMRSA